MEEVKEPLFYYSPKDFAEYKGAKLIEVGEPFRSGNYAGVFVPCTVLMSGGKTRKLNVAMRNDNKNKVWMLDGGI